MKRTIAPPDWKSLMTLLHFLKPHRVVFAVAFAALLVASALNLAIPEIVRRLLEPSTYQQLVQNPQRAFLILLGVFALQAIFTFTRYYFFSIVGQRVLVDVRRNLFSVLLKERISYLDTTNANDLTSRVVNDAALVQDAVSVRLSVVIRYAAQVVIGVLCMAWLSWILTAASAVAIFALVIVSFVLARGLRRRSKEQQEAIAATSVFASENFSGIKVIRSLHAEGHTERKFELLSETVKRLGISRSRYAGLFASGMSFVLYSILAGLLIFGILLVHRGALSASEFAAFTLYGAIVAASFSFLISGYSELVQSLGGLSRVFEIIERTPAVPIFSEVRSGVGDNASTEAERIGVRLRAVSFGYGSEREAVLNHIDIDLLPGTTTALVGISGSGKTSLVSLLLGFYGPHSGNLEFYRGNGSQIEPEAVRIGWAPQEPSLFSLSVKENLLYGRPSATLAEMRTACEIAGCLELVESLPHGFDSQIGERGVSLSGGQRQRLAIVRAILQKPQLLILDEATSGLDSKAEDELAERIRTWLPNLTILLISHRLATVKRAESIIVLDRGRVVQKGTHGDLTAREGLYRDHAVRQSLEA